MTIMPPKKHEILGKPSFVEPSFMRSAYTKYWFEGIRVKAEKTYLQSQAFWYLKFSRGVWKLQRVAGGNELQG
jgi:hypothetical protein